MAEPIEIVQRDLQPALMVAARTTTLGIPALMGKSLHRIMAVMDGRGLEMAAPPYTLYRDLDWDITQKAKGAWGSLRMLFHRWELEIGIPLAQQTAGEGEVQSGSIPAGRYLKTRHIGPYRTMHTSYERLQAYAQQQGFKLADFAIEVYVNDPGSVATEAIETELLVPLVDS